MGSPGRPTQEDGGTGSKIQALVTSDSSRALTTPQPLGGAWQPLPAGRGSCSLTRRVLALTISPQQHEQVIGRAEGPVPGFR